MSTKTLVALLIGINVAIVLIIILLPKQEWMNYLVAIFVGVLAYLFHLAHLHFLDCQETHKRTSIKTIFGKIGLGVSLGCISMSIALVIISLLGGYSEGEKFEQFNQGEVGTTKNIFDVIVLYGSSALAEETLFRSFGIGILMIPVALLAVYLIGRRNNKSRGEYTKSRLAFKIGMILNVLIALLFGFVHKDSPGFGFISFMNIAVSGVIYGYLFLIHKDIISAWSMHLSWNLFQIFAGLPVSGKYIPSASLFGELFHGAKDNIIAGGSYGPEGSVITLLVQLCLVAVLFKYLKNDTSDEVLAVAPRAQQNVELFD